ncbi:hypothetical protein [Vogesella oryzae]|uniref:hypothetical protein n=1 Tax=Vogesella oryzae TaxID=1735285 RepID=UPI00158234DE|nr:hypothetical protein [Vogesella oryzae]
MSILPATIGHEVGAQLHDMLRNCRVVGAGDFGLRRLEREVAKLKAVDPADYWRLNGLVCVLKGDVQEFVRSVRLAATLSNDPEVGLHFFPLLISVGELELAKSYVGDWIAAAPVRSYSATAGYLYYLLDARRLVMLSDFMKRVGHADELELVERLKDGAMDVLGNMPDAAAYVDLVSGLVAKTAMARGVLLNYRPNYRYDLEEGCLYCSYLVRMTPEEAIALEDAFWENADSAQQLQDGNVHVMFRSTGVDV